jgi:primosomal protein N'
LEYIHGAEDSPSGERADSSEVTFIETYKPARSHFKSLAKEEQEAFSQEEMNMLQILDLDPTKRYIDMDLDQHDILDRALRLLNVAKFGQGEEHMHVSPSNGQSMSSLEGNSRDEPVHFLYWCPNRQFGRSYKLSRQDQIR